MTSFDISVSLLIEKQIKFQNDTFNSVYLYKQWKSDSTAIANCWENILSDISLIPCSEEC